MGQVGMLVEGMWEICDEEEEDEESEEGRRGRQV